MAAFIVCFFVILCVGTLLAQANWGGAYHSQFDSRQRYQQGLEFLYGLEGIGLDLKEAVKWFSASKESGAKVELGYLYLMGLGVRQSIGKARELWAKEARKGNEEAALALKAYDVMLDRMKSDMVTGTDLRSRERKHVIKDFKGWLEAAGNGDPESCFQLAEYLLLDQQIPEGIRWMEAAAERKHLRAGTYLYVFHSLGWGMEKDQAQAKKWFTSSEKALTAAAAGGDAEAIFGLYELYDAAREMEPERKIKTDPHELLVQSARTGLAEAQYRLGNRYLQDFFEMVTEFNKDPQQEPGETKSDQRLPLILTGHGLFNPATQTRLEAVSWLRLAGCQNSVKARILLGWIHAWDTNTGQSKHQALKWLQLFDNDITALDCAQLGDAYLGNTINTSLTTPSGWRTMVSLDQPVLGIGSIKMLAPALRYYHRSASLGLPYAMFALGMCHLRGTGVRQSKTAAAKWLSQAAEAGHPKSQFMISRMHGRGVDVKRDKAKEMKWLLAAARNGIPEAARQLAWKQVFGEKGKRNKKLARQWLKQAADSGSPEAAEELGMFEVIWPAGAGSPEVQYDLGMRFLEGDRVRKNRLTATTWFNQAASQGYEPAREAISVNFLRMTRDQLLDIELTGDAEALYALGRRSQSGIDIVEDVDLAFRCYSKAARLGHAGAMFELGECYLFDEGCERDKARALEWFGNAVVKWRLGLIYEFGWGGKAEYGKAVRWLREAACLGEPRAQAELGHLLFLGIGTERDIQAAKHWWQQSAKQGYLKGKLALQAFKIYQTRMTLTQSELEDLPLAEKLPDDAISKGSLKREAEEGDARAQYYYGRIEYDELELWDGYGSFMAALTSRGLPWYTVISWLRLSSYQGFTNARLLLANIHRKGHGIRHDPDIATKVLTLFEGHETSIDYAILGDALTKDYDTLWKRQAEGDECESWLKDRQEAFQVKRFQIGISKNLPLAVKYLRKAAEFGYPASMYALGKCYLDGEGIGRDATEAIKWLKQAAELGYSRASYDVGSMYYNGDGVEMDKTEAFKWFHKSAEAGDNDAMFFVGKMYLEGDGTEQNHEEAFKWFNQAEKREAELYRGYCYFHGWGVKRDGNKALEEWSQCYFYYGQIAGEVMYHKGLIYLEGLDVEQDTEKAVAYFIKAAEYKSEEARKKLEELGVEYDVDDESFRHQNFERIKDIEREWRREHPQSQPKPPRQDDSDSDNPGDPDYVPF